MIYMDMTSCLDYIGRNPLGIVRVEMNYVQWALRNLTPEQITFCYYDRGLGKMGFLRFSDAQGVLDQIGRPTSQQPAAAAAPASNTQSDSPKAAFRAFAKSMYLAFSGAFAGSPRVQRIFCRAKRAFKRLLGERVDGMPPSVQTPAGTGEVRDSFVLDWKADDVFVTVGLIWDYLPLDKIYVWKKRLGFKVVGMIYDLVPYKVPEYCLGVPPAFFRSVVDLLWCADAIATISDQTRRDVEAFIEKYQLPRPKTIGVTYLGTDVGTMAEGYVPDAAELDVSRLKPGRFILQVGTIEPRKNHALTLTAWRMMAKEGFPELMPLVVVGAQAWGVGDVMEMARRDRALSPKYFVHSNRVSDQTLLWLYKNCFMTVYPSFYEGWGLPVSESLTHGKFCLAGDNGALVEAGAGYAGHLSPFDVVGWARRLKELMCNPSEVEKLNARIREEYRMRTWATGSEDFFKVVNVANGDRK